MKSMKGVKGFKSVSLRLAGLLIVFAHGASVQRADSASPGSAWDRPAVQAPPAIRTITASDSHVEQSRLQIVGGRASHQTVSSPAEAGNEVSCAEVSCPGGVCPAPYRAWHAAPPN